MSWEVGGFDERGRERAAGCMTTTSKTKHPTRQQRLAAALRDNLGRRKVQARNRANEPDAPIVAEPESRDARHETEADC
jgi:hypothetical protein